MNAVQLHLTNIGTGIDSTVLCLQVHTETIWAGVYERQEARAPLEIGVATKQAGVRLRGDALVVAGQSFQMKPEALQTAIEWLQQRGVRTAAGRKIRTAKAGGA